MRARHRRIAAAIVSTALIVIAAACGSKSTNEGGAASTGENVASGAFKVQIQSVSLPTSAGAQPVVTFRASGANDAPVDDLAQRIKNGAVATGQTPTYPWASPPRFTLSVLQAGGDYQSYYTVTATGAPYTLPGATAPTNPTLPSATQATFKAVTAASPEIVAQGNGVYSFTMPALPAGTTVDAGATHTAAVWVTNHPSATDDPESATSTLNFVPNGGAPAKLEEVTTAACNRCHGPVAPVAHDERLGTQVCLTCHSPQTTDPETGNTVNFKVMIHRIHFGGGLPSAQGATGTPYTIVGFRQSVSVFDASFINDVRNCTVCHQGADADNWKNNASFAACTSCHDNVRFDGSAGAVACTLGKIESAPCNHPSGIPATTDCRQCHSATAPQIGVQTVHVPLSDQAKAFTYDILSVTVDATTRVPTARVAVRRPDGSAYDLATDPAYTNPGASLAAIFAWTSQEFTNEGVPGQTSPGQPGRVAIVAAGKVATAGVVPVAGQTGVYDVTGPALPAAAQTPVTSAALLGGAANAVTTGQVHLEGHPFLKSEAIPVQNAFKTFALGGQAPDRRQVVDVAKCDNCHGYLSAHGANRNNVPQVCVECHNPRATDYGRRLSATAAPACQPGTTEQSIDFKRMIHVIHSADIRKDKVTICGFGNTPTDFPSDVGLPHGVANCNLCHVNDSWNAPQPTSAIPLDTVFGTNATPSNQADDTFVARTIAVCTSCHDQTRFVQETPALPLCNTQAVNSAPCLHSGGAQADDRACALCHAKGQLVSIDKVHPIQ